MVQLPNKTRAKVDQMSELHRLMDQFPPTAPTLELNASPVLSNNGSENTSTSRAGRAKAKTTAATTSSRRAAKNK